MTGASESHNTIVVNVAPKFGNNLKTSRKVYANDMRVRVDPTGLFTYPDIAVTCGKAQFDDTHLDTLLNPVLIVEVLSDSTEAYDRGANSNTTASWTRWSNTC